MVTVEHHWSGVQLQPQCSKVLAYSEGGPEYFDAAEKLFVGTGVNVTAEGKQHPMLVLMRTNNYIMCSSLM